MDLKTSNGVQTGTTNIMELEGMVHRIVAAEAPARTPMGLVLGIRVTDPEVEAGNTVANASLVVVWLHGALHGVVPAARLDVVAHLGAELAVRRMMAEYLVAKVIDLVIVRASCGCVSSFIFLSILWSRAFFKLL